MISTCSRFPRDIISTFLTPLDIRFYAPGITHFVALLCIFAATFSSTAFKFYRELSLSPGYVAVMSRLCPGDVGMPALISLTIPTHNPPSHTLRNHGNARTQAGYTHYAWCAKLPRVSRGEPVEWFTRCDSNRFPAKIPRGRKTRGGFSFQLMKLELYGFLIAWPRIVLPRNVFLRE